ncbi:hypothetical protein NOM73_01345 [Erwinia persicina]|uniref:hypothetical protein n=1 Tax=Erwinia persicina TaxID=55211 RepID=UPI00210CE090|nr:hypothetical protein [Erwinia persicina]MCQ4093301.1 hypothetical protein [Erwinia persicina]MCQ4099069.1 hypothetical protein [Erwinia persicina]
MHPESVFLSQFKAISQQLMIDPREKINQLALLLSENSIFLDESSETIDMINAISHSIESDFTIASLQAIEKSNFCFWQKLLLNKKMDIFFFGDERHAAFFFDILDKEKVGNLFYINVTAGGEMDTEAFLSPLQESCHPVIIYDHGADAVKSLPETQGVMLMADFQQVMVLKALPFSVEHDPFIAFLQHKHNMMLAKKPPTLVLGNSYGYYALPANCLNKAVNLSMHSLDLRQAHTMIQHYSESKKIKSIVLVCGYFDLFYELYKTREKENVRVVHIMSHYNHKNNIIPDNDIATKYLHHSDESLLAHFLPVLKSSDRLTEFNYALDDAVSLASTSENLEKQINQASSIACELYETTSETRAALHSKLYKYKESKNINSRLIAEMRDLAKDKGIRIHYVIPPFPEKYVESVQPAMIAETRAFLKSMETYHFSYHDFNEDKSFIRTDFRDGDHLNYHGAVKFVKALKKKGLVL